MTIKALIPIKTESDRLKNKNFLPFNGKPLYRAIIDKLHVIDEITEIVINTDSDIIAKEYAKSHTKVRILERPQHIRDKTITANTLIDYDLSMVEGEHFLQTHCTNPLISVNTIKKAIKTYTENLGAYDSLFSVDRVQKRVFNHLGEPVNHDNKILKQTQDLPPVFVENSNFFIFSRASFYNASKSRVGKKPFLFETNAIESFDIDYEEDFILAELIEMNKARFGISD